MKNIIVLMMMSMIKVIAIFLPWCPEWVSYNGYTRDLGLLSETVSWEDAAMVHGQCGTYKLVHEMDGVYDTRMRIYHSDGNTFIVFRPIQSTEEGQAIHQEEHTAPCTFLSGCVGRVHDHFQEAFLSLVSNVDDYLQGYVFTTGHGIGGSLQLFMSLWLWTERSIIPRMAFGFGSPFIGNKKFTETYLHAFRNSSSERWWQTSTFSLNEPEVYDHAIEDIQPQAIMIDTDAVCGFGIFPLPIPSVSYSMHDLKQYRLFLQGTDCSP